MKKSIFDVLWSMSGLGARTIIQVIYFILLARVLGPKEYGALSASFGIINIFGPFVTWGAGDILVKNVSRNRKLFGEYWGAALLSIVLFGSIFFLFTLALYFFLLSGKVNILPVILLCISEFFFVQIVNVSIQAYQSFELLSRTALIQFVFSLIRVLFTILFVIFFKEHSLTSWAAFYLSCGIFSALFCFAIVRIELGRAKFVLSRVTNNLLERFYFSLSSSSQSLYNDFDKSILPNYTSLEITGNYSASYKMIDAFYIPIRAILHTFYPRFFVKGTNGINSVRKFANKLFPVIFFYSVFATVALIFFSRFIPLLLGNSYNGTVNIIRILSPVIIFKALHSLGGATLTGAGMQGRRSAAQVFVAILNAILCLSLIPTYGWMGAAWASLLSDGALALLVWIIIFSSSRAIPASQKWSDIEDSAPSKSGID